MADTLGQAYVQIIPSADGISGAISKTLNPEATRAGSEAGTRVSTTLSDKISSVGASLAKSGALMTAISVPLIAGINKALDAYEVQMLAEQKLTEIYRTRMGASEEAAQATMDLASALQQTGIIGDEVSLSGAQQLATFAQYPETVDALLPAMDNLLAQQKGFNATTQDAVNVANLMGKAMQGNTGALTRVGITFDEAQEQVLKYGTEEERAAMLAEVINQNVGNMNETLANTPLGQIQQMKNTVGDLKEEIGAQLAPVVAQLALLVSTNLLPAIQNFIAFMESHPIIAKAVVGITAFLAIGGPLLTLIGGIAMGIGALSGVFAVLASPVTLIIGLIAGLVAGFMYLWETSSAFRAFFIKIWWNIKDTVQSVVEFFQSAIGTIQQAWGSITGFFSGIVQGIIQTFSDIKEKITEPFDNARETISGIVEKIKGFFPIHFGNIFSGLKLPHFHVSGGEFPYGVAGKGSLPSFSIEWYKKAEDQPYMFSGATLFGAGERNDEILYGRRQLMRDIATASSANGGDITINVYGSNSMSVTELAAAVEQRLIEAQKRRRLAWQ
ncbi:MAG: hypothetical protein J6M06_01780 [Synergistaceae bacterium]|nr:hypothetical protein [Synergistaceae bacterium]